MSSFGKNNKTKNMGVKQFGKNTKKNIDISCYGDAGYVSSP
jgi:hypothetical protein